MLFGVSGEETAGILARLKTDGAFRDTVLLLGDACREYDAESARLCDGERGKTAYLRIFCGKYGKNKTALFAELLRLTRGDADYAADSFVAEGCKESISLKSLAVGGRDISKLGLRGVRIGDALDRLVTLAALGEVQNEKTALLDRIADLDEFSV